MKKITLILALFSAIPFCNAQGLQGVIVEKYYLSNAADSTNASNNGAVTELHSGSVTYRVFLDLAAGYKFIQMFGNSDALSNVIHPFVIKTTTDFYNDPNNGQIFPQGNSVTNTKKNTTLIDSWLTVGGVCTGKMGVLKTEDNDNSIGNSNGILVNNPGGVFGAPINSVVAGAADGLLPGTPLSPNSLGLGNATDIFDQTAGNTFSVVNGSVAGLGGVMGVTSTNMVLLGQFTTNGVLCFSLNVQIQNTVTSVSEIYVPSNIQTGEFLFPALQYCSASSGTVVGFEESMAGKSTALFSVYPNPSKGLFTFSADNLEEGSDYSYVITDVMGRVMIKKEIPKVSGSVVELINLSDLNAGIYFMNIQSNGTISTKKIIKE